MVIVASSRFPYITLPTLMMHGETQTKLVMHDLPVLQLTRIRPFDFARKQNWSFKVRVIWISVGVSRWPAHLCLHMITKKTEGTRSISNQIPINYSMPKDCRTLRIFNNLQAVWRIRVINSELFLSRMNRSEMRCWCVYCVVGGFPAVIIPHTSRQWSNKTLSYIIYTNYIHTRGLR